MSSDLRNDAIQRVEKARLRPLIDLRVLVVDDNSVTLRLVTRMLEALGFVVDTAQGGPAAIRALDRSHRDLVVTDYQMPEVDGYTLATWIKQHAESTRVVMMTGCDYAEVSNYMNSGLVDAWIFKPFKLGQLAELLSELQLGQAKPSEAL